MVQWAEVLLDDLSVLHCKAVTEAVVELFYHRSVRQTDAVDGAGPVFLLDLLGAVDELRTGGVLGLHRIGVQLRVDGVKHGSAKGSGLAGQIGGEDIRHEVLGIGFCLFLQRHKRRHDEGVLYGIWFLGGNGNGYQCQKMHDLCSFLFSGARTERKSIPTARVRSDARAGSG